MFSLREDINYHECHINIALISFQCKGAEFLKRKRMYLMYLIFVAHAP